MAIATTDEVILMGDISVYLAANDNALGAVFGARIDSPLSALTIAMVTDALRWGNFTGQDETSLRELTNYLIWLIGKYGQDAEIIAGGSGGGSVIPGSGVVPTPKVIFGSDFSNATDWEYAPYAGKNLTVFSNGIADYLTYGTQWIYIPTGIRIIMDGFDSSLMDYFMVITIIR